MAIRGGRNGIEAEQFADRSLIYSDAETERRKIYGSTCMVASLVTN
jgi:hypothetical protein